MVESKSQTINSFVNESSKQKNPEAKRYVLEEENFEHSVRCPVCQQEFWGELELIFCKCGWIYDPAHW